MTTTERNAFCSAFAEEIGKAARMLENLAMELAEFRDNTRESLGLTPISDGRQMQMRVGGGAA